jgi:transcription initiation factor TFIID subunit 1
MQEAEAFLFPVSSKSVTTYYDVIKRPMDLQTIRDNVQNKKYHSREEFLGDINQMVENSSAFNGEASILTINSKVIMDRVVRRFTENEDRLMKLEKMINPLLDDNDQNALTYILDNILNEKIKTMQESWPFMKPVNKKQVKDYYEKIKQPMDLETISRKITSHKYHSRDDFVKDMRLIFQNSLVFNGENSEFTVKAKILIDTVEDTLVPFADHCESLEANIMVAQQRALEQADLDSLGTSFTDDNEPKKKRKKKKHDISNDFIDVGHEASPDADTGDLMDDLQYSSEDEDDDWDEVEDSQDPSQGFTINVDQTALIDQQQQPVSNAVQFEFFHTSDKNRSPTATFDRT